MGPVTLTPTLRLELLQLNVDGYNEHGANGLDLQVKSQSILSVQSALGGRVAYAISTPVAVLTPQIMIEWRHEYADNKRTITAKYINDVSNTFFALPTDDPDRDYAALGASLAAQFSRGVSAFVNFETALGLKHVSNYQFTGGIRVEF
jgi:outer membrane autotransporter protein